MTGSLEREILPRLAALEDAVGLLMAERSGVAVEPVAEERLYLGSELGENQHDALVGAGLDTNEKVRKATDKQLRAIRGIGPATILLIRKNQ